MLPSVENETCEREMIGVANSQCLHDANRMRAKCLKEVAVVNSSNIVILCSGYINESPVAEAAVLRSV